MARFSVGGSEAEEDGHSNNSKRPVSESSRTSTVGGYQDNHEHGSHSIRFFTKRFSPRTKKLRFSTRAPDSAGLATTSAGPAPRFVDDFAEEEEEQEEEEEVEEEEAEEEEEERAGEDEPMEEMEEETYEPSDTEEKTDGQLSVIISDPDVLDCPICLEPLTVPVFQCENGHIACGPCCTKMSNKCGNCCLPIGYNRCRAIEKVIESVKISCQNAIYGCKQTICYSNKLDHQKSCIHAPCSCPHIACDYVGSFKGLYLHFESNHSNCIEQIPFCCPASISLDKNEKQLFLQEKNERKLFVLNCFQHYLGNLVNIVCIGPSSAKRRYSYTLELRDGENSIKLHSVADNVPKWTGDPPSKRYLLVPNDFIGSNGKLKLEVIICLARDGVLFYV